METINHNPDILIFGQGFVGQAANNHFGPRATVFSGRVGSATDISAAVLQSGAKIIINAIGKTNTNLLEKDSSAASEGLFANCVVPMLFARALEELCDDSRILIHFSTCMTFNVTNKADLRGSNEYDEGTPGSVYAHQKLFADKLLTSLSPKVFTRQRQVILLRIHQPFSVYEHERNFFTRMLKFTTYLDEESSMTCLDDCLDLIDPLVKRGYNGIIHATNPGIIAPYAIAKRMKLLGLLEKEVEPMSRQELDTYVANQKGAHQPRVITHSHPLEVSKIEMRPINQAVDDVLNQMVLAKTATR